MNGTVRPRCLSIGLHADNCDLNVLGIIRLRGNVAGVCIDHTLTSDANLGH
jgi:hypothetical protein